jgi:hypothetical protein
MSLCQLILHNLSSSPLHTYAYTHCPIPVPSLLGPEEKGRKIEMDPRPVTEFDGKISQKIIGRTRAKNVSDIWLGKDGAISER